MSKYPLSEKEKSDKYIVQFPLCSKLGLELRTVIDFGDTRFVFGASDLERILEKSQVVYGYQLRNEDDKATWTKESLGVDTHSARLIMIEEIKRECVKHEPGERLFLHAATMYDLWKCKHCGVKLAARWEITE